MRNYPPLWDRRHSNNICEHDDLEDEFGNFLLNSHYLMVEVECIAVAVNKVFFDDEVTPMCGSQIDDAKMSKYLSVI
jgi:hypothetical protein